jgi:hypothetical protein
MTDLIGVGGRNSTEETSLQTRSAQARSQFDYFLVDYGNLMNQIERIKEICERHRDSYDLAKYMVSEIDEVLF